jgi:hypothetical protein
MFKLLLFLIQVSPILMFSSPLPSVTKISTIIPENDRKDLEQFFLLLTKYDTLAYTLFGPKPISVANFIKFTYDYPYFVFCLIFEKGWEAWLRNRHLFSDNFFVLKREDNRVACFYLINKKYTLKKIEENLAIFRKSLGEKIGSEEILYRLCSDEPMSNILSSQYLWGIFLGYGEINSQCFDRETEFFKILSGKMLLPVPVPEDFLANQGVTKKRVERCISKHLYRIPPNTLPFSHYLSEINHMEKTRKTFELSGSDSLISNFRYPSFVYWDDAENTELQNLYAKTRDAIRRAFAEGSLLDSVTKQWDSPVWP